MIKDFYIDKELSDYKELNSSIDEPVIDYKNLEIIELNTDIKSVINDLNAYLNK
jgi:hypothetical protein